MLSPALAEARFCPRCAQPARVDYPQRLSCPHSGYRAYANPKPVAAAIPRTQTGALILLRRGFAPGKDLWTFPGGFVDLGETTEQAAIREVEEELALPIELEALIGVYSRADDPVVLVVYGARALGVPQTTEEATEVAAFLPDEIPWQQLAFWSTSLALRDLLTTRGGLAATAGAAARAGAPGP